MSDEIFPDTPIDDNGTFSQAQIDALTGAYTAPSAEASDTPTVNDLVQGSDAVQNDTSSIRSVRFAPINDVSAAGGQNSMDLLFDIDLELSVELGRTSVPVRDVLNMGPGSIIELEKLAGEPVDILINGKYIAKGEVVVVDDSFGVRVTEITSRSERMNKLS